MVQGRQGAPVPDEGPVADRDAPGVLEAAAAVEEHVLAQGQVLAELAVERREDRDRLVDDDPRQPGEQRAHLVRRAVPGVEVGDDLQRLLGRPVHEGVLLGPALDELAAVHVVQKVLEVHPSILPRPERAGIALARACPAGLPSGA
ncbi:hypothetical protein D3C74_328780 [compost metagenome]